MNLEILNIKEKIIFQKLDILKDKWNYNELSHNHYLPFKYVINNPNLQWNFIRFSYNPNITLPAAKYSRFL
jgi:hypothetical protein